LATNAQTLLNIILEKEQKRVDPTLGPGDYFCIFVAEQILKNYGLSDEEIASGIVDRPDCRGGDGGIDAVYTFVNGALVPDVTEDFGKVKENALVTLYVIQTKTESSFSEEAILRIQAAVNDLFDLAHDVNDFASTYNIHVRRAINIFREAYKGHLFAKDLKLQIYFYYATKGEEIHPNVQTRANGLVNQVKKLFTQAELNFHFYTAEKLFDLSRKGLEERLTLTVEEAMTTESMGTICLVRLKDFYNFIHDEDTGELKHWLFEENVRDYEGKNVDVNKAIRETLEHPQGERDFWWLNNGITIVATQAAPLVGKELNISDPKIVNGLQTSTEIYDYFRTAPHPDDCRNILVRVVVATDDKTRNSIIIATNSQSAIKAASLRAFDPIHFKIEQFFAYHDIYYDRRKNYYKNLGYPRKKIVSINYLAQAVAAIVLQEPNNSRGRPTDLIKKWNNYRRVFKDTFSVEMYLECLQFMRLVDSYISSPSAPDYIREHEVNVRYQLAMLAAAMKSKQLSHTKELEQFVKGGGLKDIDYEHLTVCLNHVWAVLQAGRGDRDLDRISKSPDTDKKLIERLEKIMVIKEISFESQ
jgi:hypothetical protein